MLHGISYSDGKRESQTTAESRAPEETLEARRGLWVQYQVTEPAINYTGQVHISIMRCSPALLQPRSTLLYLPSLLSLKLFSNLNKGLADVNDILNSDKRESRSHVTTKMQITTAFL